MKAASIETGVNVLWKAGICPLDPVAFCSMYQPADTAKRPQQDTLDSQDVTEALLHPLLNR